MADLARGGSVGLARPFCTKPGPALALSYLWACVLGSLAVISALDYKIAFLLVPLLAPVTLIIADGIETASPVMRRRLFAIIAGFFGLAAVALPFAPALTQWPEYVTGGRDGVSGTSKVRALVRTVTGGRGGSNAFAVLPDHHARVECGDVAPRLGQGDRRICRTGLCRGGI